MKYIIREITIADFDDPSVSMVMVWVQALFNAAMS